MDEFKERLRQYVAQKREQGELQPGRYGKKKKMNLRCHPSIHLTTVSFRWIVGHGWEQDLMRLGGYPSRWDIDEVTCLLFTTGG